MPLQSRANAALGGVLRDPVAAACVSFGSGLALLAVTSLLVPSMRAGLRRIKPTITQREIPWYFLLAGCIGALFVVAQSFAAPMTGIALFTVGVVAGQTLSGLLVDHWGLGPGGARRITLARILGAVIMLGAVGLSVGDKMSGGAPSSLVWMVLPLIAGFLTSFQQAANGRSARAYGSAIAATAVNFAAGTLALGLVWSLLHLGQSFPRLVGEQGLTGQWWMYIGGACGCVYIAVNAWLLKHLGVLATAMAMIAGQLLGSLLLDLVLPVPGARSGLLTVLGLLLTFGAMLVMNAENMRRPGKTR